MPRYQTDSDTFVNTDLAKFSWDEATYHDGQNIISKATGSQWERETLYLSSKDRYYIVSLSERHSHPDKAHFVQPGDAAAWLMKNGIDLPEDLAGFQQGLEE